MHSPKKSPREFLRTTPASQVVIVWIEGRMQALMCGKVYRVWKNQLVPESEEGGSPGDMKVRFSEGDRTYDFVGGEFVLRERTGLVVQTGPVEDCEDQGFLQSLKKQWMGVKKEAKKAVRKAVRKGFVKSVPKECTRVKKDSVQDNAALDGFLGAAREGVKKKQEAKKAEEAALDGFLETAKNVAKRAAQKAGKK